MPTTSFAPTTVQPLEVKVCQCNGSSVCAKKAIPVHAAARNIRICLKSSPPTSELLILQSMFLESGEISQLVVQNDQSTEGTVIELPNEDLRHRRINSELKDEFFRNDNSSYSLKARGSAMVIEDKSAGTTPRVMTFYLDLELVNEPTVAPTSEPTIEPTHNPTRMVSQLFFGCM